MADEDDEVEVGGVEDTQSLGHTFEVSVDYEADVLRFMTRVRERCWTDPMRQQALDFTQSPLGGVSAAERCAIYRALVCSRTRM